MPLEHYLGDLQAHTNARPLALPVSAKNLLRELRASLLDASDNEAITTKPHDILHHVQLLSEPPPDMKKALRERSLHRDAFCVVGGVKNQNRDAQLSHSHFMRNDGAWFDFSITVREVAGQLELLAYDFEIRFAPGAGTPFLRFDLNLPDHANARRELRSHLHPGHDDVLIPAPRMSPAEMLSLLIYGARVVPADRKPRTRTTFEREWLRQTLDSIPHDGDPLSP